MRTIEVELAKLSPPLTRSSADVSKLLRMGPFDWAKYTPIEVERDGGRLIVVNGLTRVEAARRAGIAKLPAYVYAAS